MDKDKLYTVNKWNKPMFGNRFDIGGPTGFLGYTWPQIANAYNNASAYYTQSPINAEEAFGSMIPYPMAQGELEYSLSDVKTPYLGNENFLGPSTQQLAISNPEINPTFTLDSTPTARINPWVKYANQNQMSADDYMNSKNFLGLSKADNPLSRGNLAGGIKQMVSTPLGSVALNIGANIGSNLAYKGLSDGYSTDLGSGVGTYGNMVGSAISAVNPLAGTAVSLGSGVVGGLVNHGFGIKTNKNALNNYNNALASWNNYTSNASTYDQMRGPENFTFQDIYKGGWFTGGKARRRNREALDNFNAARGFANRSFENNARYINNNQFAGFLRNYSAYGGPLGNMYDGEGDRPNYLLTTEEAPNSLAVNNNIYQTSDWFNNQYRDWVRDNYMVNPHTGNRLNFQLPEVSITGKYTGNNREYRAIYDDPTATVDEKLAAVINLKNRENAMQQGVNQAMGNAGKIGLETAAALASFNPAFGFGYGLGYAGAGGYDMYRNGITPENALQVGLGVLPVVGHARTIGNAGRYMSDVVRNTDFGRKVNGFNEAFKLGKDIYTNLGGWKNIKSTEPDRLARVFLSGLENHPDAIDVLSDNMKRRAVEVAMRSSGNGSVDGLGRLFYSLPILSKDKDRVKAIAKYIFSGKQTGQKGYYNSLSLNPDNYYTGFADPTSSLVKALIPKQLGLNPNANDMIDAFLFKKEIDPSWGFFKSSQGNDFGIHTNYISKKYFDKLKDIPVYEAKHHNMIRNPFNKGSVTGEEGTLAYPGSKIGVDAGGHLVQKDFSRNYGWLTNQQDIWKFNPEDYLSKWKFSLNTDNKLLRKGLSEVDRLGTPVVTRTGWYDLGGHLFDKGGGIPPVVNDVMRSLVESYGEKKAKSLKEAANAQGLTISDIRQRLYDNLFPYGYNEDPIDNLDMVEKAVLKNEGSIYQYTPERDDVWAEYLSIPENKRHSDNEMGGGNKKVKVIDSQYSPTIGRERKKYKTLSYPEEYGYVMDNDGDLEHPEDKIRYRKQSAVPNSVIELSNDLDFGKNKTTKKGVLAGTLGTYTVGKGVDENRGEYRSWYDLWDLAPNQKYGEDESAGIGTPVPFYDRIYLDDYYGVPTEKTLPKYGDYYGGYIPEVTIDGNSHKFGGSIHIDPIKKGTFTTAASKHGMGVQEFASKVLEFIDDINSRSSSDFVNRLKDENRSYISDWNNRNNLYDYNWATHKMSWATDENGDAIVYPEVQTVNGKLHDFTDPWYGHGKWDGFNNAVENGDTLRMSPEQADWFTRNYKDYYPKGRTFAGGGITFLNDFSNDPISALATYRQMQAERVAQREAMEEERAREQQQLDLQNRLSELQTQYDTLQELYGAQADAIKGMQDIYSQSPTIPPTILGPYAPMSALSNFVAKGMPRDSKGNIKYESSLPKNNKNWNYIKRKLKESGRFTDVQIEGIGLNLMRESGFDFNAVGDGGHAFGLAQWHKPRQPKDRSLDGQINYIINTLADYDGNLHWIGKDNYNKFMQARTPEEAHYYIANGWERPDSTVMNKVRMQMNNSLRNAGFAFGGELGTNGTDWYSGLLQVNEGSSHELNPLGGVQMGVDQQGTPNLVEEGETVYKGCVFSDRDEDEGGFNVPVETLAQIGIKPTKKELKDGISYADASKKVSDESKERPNDPISKAGLEHALAVLAESQEMQRQERQMMEQMAMNVQRGYAALGGRLCAMGGNLFTDGGPTYIADKRGDNLLGYDSDGNPIELNVVAPRRWTSALPLTWTPEYRERERKKKEEREALGRLFDYTTQMAFPELKLMQPSTSPSIPKNDKEKGMSKETYDYLLKRAVLPIFEEQVGYNPEEVEESFKRDPFKATSTPVYPNNVLDYIKDFIKGDEYATGGPLGSPYALGGNMFATGRQMNTLDEDPPSWWNFADRVRYEMKKQEEARKKAPKAQYHKVRNYHNVKSDYADRQERMAEGTSKIATWKNYGDEPTTSVLEDDGTPNSYRELNSPLRRAEINIFGNYLDPNYSSQFDTDLGYNLDRGSVPGTNDNPYIVTPLFHKWGQYTQNPSDWKPRVYDYKNLYQNGNANSSSPSQATTASTNQNVKKAQNNASVSTGNTKKKANNQGAVTSEATNPTASTNGTLASAGNTNGSNTPVEPFISPTWEAWKSSPFGMTIGVNDSPTYQATRDILGIEGRTPSAKDISNSFWTIAKGGNGSGEMERENEPIKPLPTWMRYAPIFASGTLAFTDALGITNKPDYEYANRLEAMANRMGYAPDVQPTHIGDYIGYRPMDRLFYENQMQAAQRAADRNLMNVSGGNRATAQAGILGNNYNGYVSLGQLARQAEEYNLAQRQAQAQFNRGTNQFNAQQDLEAQRANAQYTQMARNYMLSGLAQAYGMRSAIDQMTGATRSANLTNLIQGLANIGRENFAVNQINSDYGFDYGIGKGGWSRYKYGNYGNNPYPLHSFWNSDNDNKKKR